MKSTQDADGFVGDQTILVVDDDVKILTVVAAMLKKSGYRVITAAGPLPALSTFDRHRETIDLVISDVRMPEMSGPDLVACLCATKPTIRSMFMTACADQLTDGCRVLEKPFCMSELQAKVAEALASEDHCAESNV